tara:strand:+ start:16784 stop:17536 length:753 start_codon:yes stop_codon:yes gene_type:complete
MKHCTFITSFFQGGKYIKRFAYNAHKIAKHFDNNNKFTYEFLIVANDISNEDQQQFNLLLEGLHFKLVNTAIETVYASWNRAINHSPNTDLFVVWNMDDLRYTSGTHEQFQALSKEDGPAIVLSEYHQFEFSLMPFKIRFYRRVPPINSPTPFLSFNREALILCENFEESFMISGDREWLYRAIEKNCKIKVIKKSAGILVNYGIGLSTSDSPERICENLLIQEMYPNQDQHPYFPYYKKLRDKVLKAIK